MSNFITTFIPHGVRAQTITIECDMSNNLPSMVLVGLGAKTVDEARERVRSAIRNSELHLPPKRITINLAPADIKKDSASLDLPIAIAILATSGQIPLDKTTGAAFVGELGLGGEVRAIKGSIGLVRRAEQINLRSIYVPRANIKEVEALSGIDIYPVDSLRSLALHLLDQVPIEKITPKRLKVGSNTAPPIDFGQIVGHDMIKRALTIAAAGKHNVLMYGPPGTGKSMLAKSLPGIMPDLNLSEALDVIHINSLCGEFSSNLDNISRPIRSPHHSASAVSVVGGGNSPRPGEITRAHHGVLLLDEFPEFPKSIIEALRQPIEDGHVTIARASSTLTMPADFMLVATANPCPCGYLGDKTKPCTCNPNSVTKYQQKISGPILDRIDILIRVDRLDQLVVGNEARTKAKKSLESPAVKHKVSKTRNLIMQTPSDDFVISPEADQIFRACVLKMDLSPRSQTRLMRLARTIAALDERTTLNQPDILEAAQYIDKSGWQQ